MILNGCYLSSGGICKPYKTCSSKSYRSASSCTPLPPSKVIVTCVNRLPAPHHYPTSYAKGFSSQVSQRLCRCQFGRTYTSTLLGHFYIPEGSMMPPIHSATMAGQCYVHSCCQLKEEPRHLWLIHS